MSLKLDWCSFAAAKYACENWHYSQSTPAGKLVKVGAWEDGRFIGCVIFSRGANQHMVKQFKLDQTQGCELTRVALREHKAPVSKIVAIAIKMLKKANPGLKLIISYADLDQEHAGTIYQAGNWTYLGRVQTGGGTPRWKIHGKVMHGRSVASRGWKQTLPWVHEHIDPDAELIYTKGKHKYAFALHDDMKPVIGRLRQPYPKRGKQAMGGHHPPQRRGSTDRHAPKD